MTTRAGAAVGPTAPLESAVRWMRRSTAQSTHRCICPLLGWHQWPPVRSERWARRLHAACTVRKRREVEVCGRSVGQRFSIGRSAGRRSGEHSARTSSVVWVTGRGTSARREDRAGTRGFRWPVRSGSRARTAGSPGGTASASVRPGSRCTIGTSASWRVARPGRRLRGCVRPRADVDDRLRIVSAGRRRQASTVGVAHSRAARDAPVPVTRFPHFRKPAAVEREGVRR